MPPKGDFKVDHVTFSLSPVYYGECVPLVATAQSSSSEGAAASSDINNALNVNVRPFETEDISRVMDHENMPEPLPADAAMGHLEVGIEQNEEEKEEEGKPDFLTPQFPQRYCLLRGSFIFYYDLEDVQLPFRPGLPPTFLAPPRGVIPLERTVVEFPPGGRRVFREHATSDARTGYEMVIRHILRTGTTTSTTSGGNEEAAGTSGTSKRRAPAYLVADSLGQREAWAKAIRIRADVYKKETKLRSAVNTQKHDMSQSIFAQDSFAAKDRTGGEEGRPTWDTDDTHEADHTLPSARNPKKITFGGNLTLYTGNMQPAERADLEVALHQFAENNFSDIGWVQDFFERRNQNEASTMFTTLEKWQSCIKKGLRGAVLEQYEYFVDASRELTGMGQEVVRIHNLAKIHTNTVEAMMNMDFGSMFEGGPLKIRDKRFPQDNKYDEDYLSDEDDNMMTPQKPARLLKNFKSSTRSISTSSSFIFDDSQSQVQHLFPHLVDATEEISALIRESRFTDATETILKAKTELVESMNQHGEITGSELSGRQERALDELLATVNNLADHVAQILIENLRIKNNFLKKMIRNGRNEGGPLISPACLGDDLTSLRLLIRLNRSQDAAAAFSARRSLSIQQCFAEKPIATTTAKNNADVVFYASQLSSSFFNALSQNIEAFLDLYHSSSKGPSKDDTDDLSTITGAGVKAPAEALSSIALWCDTELSKFATEFGAKVLSNLTLCSLSNLSSPPVKIETVPSLELAADLASMKRQMQAAQGMGDYEAVEKLRKKIDLYEKKDDDAKVNLEKAMISEKDRKNGIDLAAKCIEQILIFSSEALNSIGLPLTPRLIEFLRPRLSGCESEIADILAEKWGHITYCWKLSPPSMMSNASDVRRSYRPGVVIDTH